jgi:PhnB protein
MLSRMGQQQAGYHTITPYLVMERCADAIEFYKTVFGATEVFRTTLPGGAIGHAELEIGDSRVMIADAHSGSPVRSPSALGGTSVTLMLYVPDADEVFQRAIAAGAREDDPVQDKPYGDRSGSLIDPFGHRWTIATHVTDVSHDGMTAGGFAGD